MADEKKNPAGGRGLGHEAGGFNFHSQNATAAPLLAKAERVQKSGNGGNSWRMACTVCGGKSQKLVVTERDNKVLLHAFCGHSPDEVLAAAGLSWRDIQPPRHWPQTREEQARARQAIKQAGWASALQVLPMEAAVVRIAAAKMLKDEPLDWEDYCRLVKAEEIIANAATALTERRREY